MGVTLNEVKKIAELARLHFDERELTVYCEHLNEILNYVDKLNELDTENVEPTYSVRSNPKTMRDDQKKSSLPLEEVMKNAPAQKNGFFSVPSVIDDGGEI
jgi:aspartyl-tRNA(Asn)/glutamyl-tRNA(Gln) amidotransferase subunit C